jgi:hypothetical protein
LLAARKKKLLLLPLPPLKPRLLRLLKHLLLRLLTPLAPPPLRLLTLLAPLRLLRPPTLLLRPLPLPLLKKTRKPPSNPAFPYKKTGLAPVFLRRFFYVSLPPAGNSCATP